MGGFGMNQMQNSMFSNPAMVQMGQYAHANALQQAGPMGGYTGQMAKGVAGGSMAHFNQSLSMMKEQLRQQQIQGMLTALMQQGGTLGQLFGQQGGMHGMMGQQQGGFGGQMGQNFMGGAPGSPTPTPRY